MPSNDPVIDSTVTAADVLAAAERIAPYAHRTPVLTSSRLDEALGLSLFAKCESFQRMGAFKFRGAVNAISRLPAEQRRAGVVAFSSGNHAQAIALAARLFGVPATILMPTDAPAAKLAATRGYGAEILPFDRTADDREALAAALARERGLTLIPPYDHPHIVAGQGTAALELIEEVPDLDVVITPLGGGGLLSGTALITADRLPSARIYGAEPAAGDDGKRSFDSGEIVHIPTPVTIADGAQTQHLGTIPFAIIRDRVTDILTITDEQILAAMRDLARTMKIVVEPTGALGIAALSAYPELFRGRRVGVIISGGNVDLDRYAALLAG